MNKGNMNKARAIIALEDGAIFYGRSCGIDGERAGEIVFNTAITGYQEIMTDPSYKGQIVTMTYPLIGNYGVNSEDIESISPKVEGLIVKELSKITSNYRAEEDLIDYFKRHNILAVEDVDTRAITRHIRLKGAMKGIVSTIDLDPKRVVEKARASEGIIGKDFVKEVTCKSIYEWTGSEVKITEDHREGDVLKVVVFDFGVKMNILRILKGIGCKVIVVPASTSADAILALSPDGILLSNGPGDPGAIPYVIKEARRLLGKAPLFGISFGHQLLGLALGGRTYKLKFGHHGVNQPIKELDTGRVFMASENHGFAVEIESIKGNMVRPTHINLNDNTIEGMDHMEYPAFSVQYQPEGSPGPQDTYGLFTRFKDMMVQHKEMN